MEPVIDRLREYGGVQKIYRFANGYGASIVKGMYTYGGREGLWELAVIHFNSEDDLDFEIDFNTPITDDVIGHLRKFDVEKLLCDIENLPKRKEK